MNEGHKKLAQKIISLHQAKNPFTVRPKYCYEQLQKGFNCHLCHSFQIYKKDNEFVCGKCGGHEKIELAIVRHVNEFKLLFPDRRITTHSIYNWCNVALNERTIRRALKKNFTSLGNSRDTYYE